MPRGPTTPDDLVPRAWLLVLWRPVANSSPDRVPATEYHLDEAGVDYDGRAVCSEIAQIESPAGQDRLFERIEKVDVDLCDQRPKTVGIVGRVVTVQFDPAASVLHTG